MKEFELKYGCNPNQKPEAFADFLALRDKIGVVCDHTTFHFEDEA